MRKAITLWLDTAILAQARRGATMENRTLTNFIEMALKQKIAATADQPTFIVPASNVYPPLQKTSPLSNQPPAASSSSENNHD